MSIKGRWSKFLPRGIDSRSSSSSNEGSPATSPTTLSESSSSASLSKQTSRLKHTVSWVSGRSTKSSKSGGETAPVAAAAPAPSSPSTKKKTARRIPMHPSQRPLTEINLRHQEMLSKFSWNVESPPTPRRLSYYESVSPTSSPRGSFDGLSQERPLYD